MKKTLDMIVKAMVDMEAEYEVDYVDVVNENIALEKENNELRAQVNVLRAQLKEEKALFKEEYHRLATEYYRLKDSQAAPQPQEEGKE